MSSSSREGAAAKVLEESAGLAASVGGKFDPHDPLLEEWVDLTEHPVVVMGKVRRPGLHLPGEEILVSRPARSSEGHPPARRRRQASSPLPRRH